MRSTPTGQRTEPLPIDEVRRRIAERLQEPPAKHHDSSTLRWCAVNTDRDAPCRGWFLVFGCPERCDGCFGRGKRCASGSVDDVDIQQLPEAQAAQVLAVLAEGRP